MRYDFKEKRKVRNDKMKYLDKLSTFNMIGGTMIFAGHLSRNYVISSAGLGLICSVLSGTGADAIINMIMPDEFSQLNEFSELRNEFQRRERLFNRYKSKK